MQCQGKAGTLYLSAVFKSKESRAMPQRIIPSCVSVHNQGRSRWVRCSCPICSPRNMRGRSENRSRSSSRRVAPLCSSGSGILFSLVCHGQAGQAGVPLLALLLLCLQFLFHPGKILFCAGNHRYGQDFRYRIGMHRLNGPTERRKQIAPGFHGADDFLALFYGPLPAIPGRAGTELDAGCKALFQQMRSQLLCLWPAGQGGDDLDVGGQGILHQRWMARRSGQLGLEYFCKVEYLTSACWKIKPLRPSFNPNR